MIRELVVNRMTRAVLCYEISVRNNSLGTQEHTEVSLHYFLMHIPEGKEGTLEICTQLAKTPAVWF